LLRNDVEGLVGEIWLRAYRRRTDLPDDPRPWIRGIACNIRRERMRLRPTVPLDPSLAAPEDGRDAATADAVNRAIDELPEPHRTLLIWAREGRPRRVMARDLGISQPTLRRRLARAFKALRRKLGHETDERGRRSPDET
jgi:RNA polymerase sigma-70 factor (ECF subfamily)